MEDKLNNATTTTLERKKTGKESFWELARFAVIAVIVVVPIRIFIAQPFVVSGSSMVPTFQNGDYLIVDELSYRLGEPERGDVVIFRYPKDPSKFFIKRVIGLPNEMIQINGSEVKIFSEEHKEGLVLNELYVKNTSSNEMEYQLEGDEYFVMGDNRIGSSDSRMWGPVNQKYMVGRALVRLLPVDKIELLPGSIKE